MGITNVGMAQTAKLLGNTLSDSVNFGWIGIGTNNTAFAVTQTTLVVPNQQVASVQSLTTTTATNDTLNMVKDSFSFGGSYSIQEVGAFSAVSAGIMLCRTVITAIAVTATDTLKVTITVQVKQGA